MLHASVLSSSVRYNGAAAEIAIFRISNEDLFNNFIFVIFCTAPFLEAFKPLSVVNDMS